MPSKNRLFLISLLVVLITLLVITFAPFAVSNGLRLWVWWKSRQEGLIASIDKIDAPFLHSVVIRNLHVKSVRADALQILQSEKYPMTIPLSSQSLFEVD